MRCTSLKSAIATVATVGITSWISAVPAVAQNQPAILDPQQAAIQMLEENPEQVIDLMRTLLQANPGLIQQIQQNPEQVQQTLDQNSELVEYLQQHPEVLEQLQNGLQEP